MKNILFYCVLGLAVTANYAVASVEKIEKYKEEALALEREAAEKIEKYQAESQVLEKQAQKIVSKTAAKELGLPIHRAKEKIEKYVFISFSMPDEAINSLLKQAKDNQMVPILRGFKDNSYQKTFLKLEKFVQEIGYGVSIDPELFAEFEITQVPTFVMTTTKTYVCPPNSSCPKRKFYKIAGNTTATWALEQLNAAWSKG